MIKQAIITIILLLFLGSCSTIGLDKDKDDLPSLLALLAVASSGSGSSSSATNCSDDGINWTARGAAEANLWRSVTYGNNRFVAVSADGTNRVMTSDCN
ncbi:MAG: hypothetical protein O9301_06465 [Leptospira sp.]|nr:hypothetical protein [Leptospira sp.]